MKKKNNKGFTLVELMAVIIIIGIVVTIAYGIINNQIKRAHYNATKVDAQTYVREVNNQASVSRMETVKISQGIFSVQDLKELGIKVNGSNPDTGFLVLENYKVTTGCLSYDKYKVDVNNGLVSDTTKGKCSASPSDYGYGYDADYSGEIKSYTIPANGTYKLEVWGAQGGDAQMTYTAEGGYGGYTVGTYSLEKGTVLYIGVGGKGVTSNGADSLLKQGGYNGGGNSKNVSNTCWGSGGGATHIALASGLLQNVAPSQVLVVAGGGSGGGAFGSSTKYGQAGGGCVGGDYGNSASGAGGTQSAGGIGRGSGSDVHAGTYGQGGIILSAGGGGGGGFYGGGTGYDQGSPGGGGSGYLNKSYEGFISGELYSSSDDYDGECECEYTYQSSKKAIPGYMKQGNGYAKITFISS